MMRFVKDEYVNYIAENAENLATKGLRTLVLSQKLIPQDYFDKWNKEYEEAKTSMEDRQQKIADPKAGCFNFCLYANPKYCAIMSASSAASFFRLSSLSIHFALLGFV